MNVLITNDDGINAIGIRSLAKELSKVSNVTVVAPDRERSATGHAITMHHPLRISRVDNYEENILAFSVDGTPSDCVKIAIESILENKPDLVISGINNGPNLGTDVLYSGTVSAAIEGAIHNIPSVAFSIVTNSKNINYEGALHYSCKLIEYFYKKNIPENIILNVNVPSANPSEIKGIRVSELGIRRYENNYVERKDPFGRSYYWLAGSLLEIENKSESDIKTTMENYISITPLHFDLTDYNYLKEMRSWDF